VYLFATYGSEFFRLFVSDNSGDTFSFKVPSEFENEGQGGYNLDCAVDPNNENVIYAGMVTLFKSTNGGDSFSQIADAGDIHADQHLLEFSPYNDDLYVGNDGGIYYTDDGGSSFNVISNGLRISQIVRMTVDRTNPDLLMIGNQDGGSYVTDGGLWYHQVQGDGFHCAIDYTNPDIMYGTSQKGNIYRSTTGGANTNENFVRIAANGVNGVNQTGSWYSAFCLDQSNPAIMFAGFKDVWRSTNVNTSSAGNISFTNISENQLSGEVIDYLEQSPANSNIIYAADKHGDRLFVCDNAYSANPTWQELSKPAFYTENVQHIEADPILQNTVYVAFKNRIYKSGDKGQTWQNITLNLPDVSMNCIEVHPGSLEGLYVGTAIGVYYKDATMTQWVKYKFDMPVTIVSDLVIQAGSSPHHLFASTYGRGVWKTELQLDYRPNLYFTSSSVTVDRTHVEIITGVRNVPGFATSIPCMLGYYLSTDNNITTSDHLIGIDTIPGLYPGIIAGVDISIDVEYVTNPPPPGTYYIGAIVDKDNIVEEMNELDNVLLLPAQLTINTPGTPQSVTASDGTYGDKIVIDWNSPAGANDTLYFRVYRNITNNPNTAQELGIVWNTNTAYWDTDTLALDGTDYYYWVRASYNFLGVNPGTFSSYNIGWKYLGPPTNVQASDGLYDDRIKITWDPPEGGTHFKVWRDTTTNINTAIPLSTYWSSVTGFTDYAVSPGQTYIYWVKAARGVTGTKASPNYSSYNSGWAALMDPPVVTATDGDFTTHIDITWTTVPGATHYMLFYSDVNDPATATPSTGWITGTYKYHAPTRGEYHYYWAKAATSIVGSMATGFSEVDSGWRKLETVQNVNARDGESADHIRVTWNNQSWADYYMVYRSTINSGFSNAIPITGWIDLLEFNDSLAPAPQDCWYWVLCANNPEIPSDQGSFNLGWRKLDEPVVDASDGLYGNRVNITWDPVPGANSYRVFRGPGYSPTITDTLTNWSSTLNFNYNDYTAVQGQNYYYLVKGAYNNYGSKPGDEGYDQGFAGECANFAEHPDPSFRNLDIRGSVLEISNRVINNGPYASTTSVDVTYYLSVNVPEGDYILYPLGTIMMPPLSSGQQYDMTFEVDLDTLPTGPLPYGTYYVRILLNGWGWNCETNLLDNVIDWLSPVYEYTDALYGEYTVGGNSPDFNSLSQVVSALNLRGITDNVTFNLRPGSFYEQFELGQVGGVDPTRKILFRTEPNEADTAEIVFASHEGNFVIQLNNASYVILENLKLISPGFTNYQSTYGRVLEITGNSNHILVQNCLIEGTDEQIYICDDNALIYCGSDFCYDVTIQDNTLKNGSYGILLSGGAGGDDAIYNLEIINNNIIDFFYKGIDLEYVTDPLINYNTLSYTSSNVTQSMGINLEYCEDGLTVNGNQIIMQPTQNVGFGIYLYFVNVGSESRGSVSNNFISINADGKPCYGLQHSFTEKTDVYYNSINIYGSPFNDCLAAGFDCTT
ncbi:MAG: hypothetical protein K8R53_00980, partial [Bacteroidales bacterium]|nr:hypothetical protein [Bacteroidales bacterium]